MSTPSGAVAPYTNGGTVSRETVQPSAIASGKSSALFAVGEVLKTLVQHSLAFHDENTTDRAVNAINAWVGSSVSASELPALLTGNERAPKEDISQRVPPGGPPASVLAGPVLDYSKLAAAILEQQAAMQKQQELEPQDTPPEG